MLAEIVDCPGGRIDDRAWRDGSAGKLVEAPAIFLYRPARIVIPLIVLAVEIQHPVGFFQFDFVAQSRRFFVGEDTHTGDTLILVDAHDQVDIAGIAIRRRYRQDHGHHLAIASRAKRIDGGRCRSGRGW